MHGKLNDILAMIAVGVVELIPLQTQRVLITNRNIDADCVL